MKVKHSPFIIEKEAKALTAVLPQIQALADSEKDALGFLPARAFQEAIIRGRLVAALVEQNGIRTFAGYLLHSGVFPNAKIQQISVDDAFRKQGAASALIKALVSELERIGFLSLQADVASDLPAALAFYERNGFERVRERAGGQARGRTIIIHSRQLETDNLFTLASVKPDQNIELGFRNRGPGEVPVFAFDLNVFFDLVRERKHSYQARRLFGEALGHTIRLAVADEFVNELRRTSTAPSSDPILQMALQLPRLTEANPSALDKLASNIYETVFAKPNARGVGTEQAKSDARHLAHATISRASAFITRDGPILNTRRELLTTFGIDIATLDEVVDLLPSEPQASNVIPLQGEGFQPAPIEASQLSAYLLTAKVPDSIVSEFTKSDRSVWFVSREAIHCENRIIAVGVIHLSKGVDANARMILHVHHEHPRADLFVDYLMDKLIRQSCINAPVAIELIHLPGQSIVNKLALARSFHRKTNALTFNKIAVGRPVTSVTWSSIVQQIRRRTGLVLPETLSSLSAHGEVDVLTPTGLSTRISTKALEDLLGPVVFVWPDRYGVIVPISGPYADELLGTRAQGSFGFMANRDAAFLSLRGYVNSPRTARKMRAGDPILFYESKRAGKGRGAAVAVARIVNSILVAKSKLDQNVDKRLVVDSVEAFSSTDDVLVTTFDNLMIFPKPVGFSVLKKLKLDGGANFVSAVSLSSEQMSSILTLGWPSDKVQ